MGLGGGGQNSGDEKLDIYLQSKMGILLVKKDSFGKEYDQG